MRTSAKLIGNLVHRVAIRLPYKSGQSIEAVEQDPIVKQTVAALIEVSKYRLPTVANTLGYVLENVSKTHQIYEQNVPVDIMQSKLFVLRLLSACMQHHWHHYCEQEKEKHPERPSNELRLNLPPLDAPLVTFILVLMSRYITQYHLIEETNSEITPRPIYDFDGTKYTYGQMKLSLITEIYKASAKIIYYVSSSNWDACYAKIKSAVLRLGSTHSNNTEDIPPEIRMLECICLNKERLKIVFKELIPYYLHMKTQGKLLFSKLLRKSIWRWIELYPEEFAQVCTVDELPDSELLFDMCNSTADNSKKRSILWPLQTILIILSPEFLMQAFMDQPSSRRVNFIHLLRKSLQTTKALDLATVCYVDVCKAATYVPPSEDSILRLMAADVETDLRDKVWNFSKLANAESTMHTLGYIIDYQTLATDYLLSRIRLDKENAIKTLIPPCIDENAPIIVKLALVKSCLVIVLEENHLSWNPSLSSLYDGICAPLRSLMRQTIQLEMSKQKESVLTNHRSRVELLVDMLKLYRTDPILAVFGEDIDRVEQNGTFMNGLATLLVHPVQVVRQDAAELLIKLHQPEIAARWTTDSNNLYHFWKITSPAIVTISNHMLDTSLKQDMQRFLLNVTIKLLKTRSVYLKHKQALFNIETTNVKERTQASISLEIALLIFLCSAHKEVCDEASVCIRIMCQEAKIVDICEEGPNQATLACNLEVYEDLSVDNYRFVGRKAQQKRFRKCLQMLPHHTPSCFAAWEEAWKRWLMLTPYVNRPQDGEVEENNKEGMSGGFKKASQDGKKDKTKNKESTSSNTISTPNIRTQQSVELNENRSIEWHNFTGFLAALGGCCLTEEKDMDEVVSLSSDYSRRTSNEPVAMVDGFILEMTEMLVSNNVYVREGIKDILGNDLSPTLLAILFRHLENYMKKLFDANGKAIRNPQNKLFVEQSVLVLRLILDRLINPSDCLLNIDFSTLMFQFIDYLDGVPNTHITLRIKIKTCMLIEVLMAKKENIIIQNEIVLRNRLLDILIEWTSDIALLRKPLEDGPQVERLQKDLDLACMKAVVNVLHQLPLQSTETVRLSDASLIKNKLFLKYFNFFRKTLDRNKRAERDIMTNKMTIDHRDGSYRSLASSSTGTSTTADSLQDIIQMKELTILAMSHLLSANVDAGLKYSLSMGYDDDQKTRCSFMQVLTNILDHGTEFETLAESVMTDRYEKLIDTLVEADIEVILALCDVCPTSEISSLAEVLLISFESRGKIVPLLKAIIDREVMQTEQEATLFRGTTIATRILSIYTKIVCGDYVRFTLLPAIEKICALPNDQLTWELDQQKIKNSEDVMKNKKNVIQATDILLNAICSSVDNAPMVFREQLSLISKSVGARFPEANFTAVGGFVFLRMFGPAILSPENSVIAKGALPKNTNVRKVLLQATRIIQNLANNVLFGAKETHMIILNDFLTANIYRVTSFLREMSTLPAQYPEQSTGALVMDQTGYIRLHTYLADNLDRISRELTSRNIGRGDTEKLLRCKKTLDRLSTLLAQLGRPSEVHGADFLSTRNYTIANNNRTFNEFMKRNGHRDLSAIRSQHIFYVGGKSKEGRPVFYFLARAIEPESMDLELLMYYILRAMEPYLNSPFEVLVDATGFTLANALPIHWITQLFHMMFNEMNDYLVAVHIYNPSTHLQRHLSKLPRPIVNRIIKRLHFYSNLNELYENFSLSEFKLSKMTLDLEKDACVTIFPVTRLTNLRTSIPVIVKIGLEEIQIITMKKQEVFYNVHAILRDIHHISEIEDITALPSSKSENGGEISIKYDRGKSTMVLASAQRDVILAHLRHSKQRYEASKPNMIHERAIRPNDVPGRLLNMALLNIGNSDPGLRLAAYNLLYSLSLSFKFNVGNQLLNAKDLCIPSNSISFIVGISERLAQNELHLTLEFLDEALVGLTKSNESMQQLCLDYMVPWLLNLGHFARYDPEEQTSSATKTKEFIISLIRLTINRVELYKHMQAKIWKTLAEVEETVNLVIDCFVQCSIEYGTGSPQAEMIADTLVTMSSVSIRGKVISRMRRLIESTSFQPCRQLTEHPAWKEIAILLRFILMLSFNNTGPILPYIPEIYHVVSILVVTGPTFIRSSVHELVVNTIHTLCTMNACLPEENVKKLHFVLNDVCDSKNRVLFGLTKQMANAFTITTETTSDYAESINLVSLQNIVKLLMDTLNYGAPTVDIANMWRARWMGLVTSTAFYFNPAIQPRSFVVLGCLAQDDVDDDLLYQILVALKGALAIFIETEPNLIISIMMCLTNIIDNLPTDSRYILHLFWLAVALVQIGHPAIFQTAVELLHSVLRALDSRKIFAHKTIEQVLLDARIDLEDCAFELDKACGVNFNEYFSFAIAVILLKGLKQCESKDIVYHCLCSFLQIDSKRSVQQGFIESRSIGYLAGLLPFIAKDDKLKELLAVAGVCEMDVENIDLGISNPSLFDFLEIPDNSTALLLVSLLVTLLNASENESEKLFLYNLLADAANWVPEVFALIYESLLPKMNQMVINSQNQDLIEAVKNILLTACSEPAFLAVPQKRTQKWGLDNLRFSSLIDPTFGAVKTNVTVNAKLASKLLGAITEHQ